MLKNTHFEKFKINDIYILCVRILKLRTELEMINTRVEPNRFSSI